MQINIIRWLTMGSSLCMVILLLVVAWCDGKPMEGNIEAFDE